MSENGGLLSVAAKDVVELPPFDSIDRTCSAVGDVKELCSAAADDKQLDGQSNGCNGVESCENCCTDSGISNSADMDICSMELLDDSEANGESCTAYEDQTLCATRPDEAPSASEHEDMCIEDTRIDDPSNSSCSESKTNGDGTAETVLSRDPSDGKCAIFDGSCNVNTSAECSHDTDVRDDENVLPANADDDSVQTSHNSVKNTGVNNALDDNGTCHNDVSEVSLSRADEDIEICPNAADVTSTDIENLPADKSLNEGTAVDGAVFTSASVSQPPSQPTFTSSSSRSVPRSSRHSRPRMGSYGSPPPSATPSSSCPDDDTSKQQYVVNVHVNPGETFSVCVSDQVQLIQGNCLLLAVNFSSVRHLTRTFVS